LQDEGSLNFTLNHAMERDLIERREADDCDWQKAAKRVESVEIGVLPIPTPRYSLLRSTAAEREADEML
jgi:hypothetical protein